MKSEKEKKRNRRRKILVIIYHKMAGRKTQRKNVKNTTIYTSAVPFVMQQA